MLPRGKSGVKVEVRRPAVSYTYAAKSIELMILPKLSPEQILTHAERKTFEDRIAMQIPFRPSLILINYEGSESPNS